MTTLLSEVNKSLKFERNTTEKLTRSPPPPYNEPYWIISETGLIAVSLFTLYLLACLTKFGIKTGCKPGSELRGKKGKILFQTLLVSVVMFVGRCVSDQVVAVVGWQSDDKCRISSSASFVFYSLSLYPVYIFLWLRQNIFYSSPVLASVLNPVVSVFSWAILVGMVVGGVIITICYVLPEITGWNFVATDAGCQDISEVVGLEVVPAVFACFTIILQLCLLALFIYPLVSKKTLKYREARRSVASTNGSSIPSEPIENSSNGFTNDQEERESNNDILDGKASNDGLVTPEESSPHKQQAAEAEVTSNPECYSYNNSGVLYRKQNNQTTKEKKKNGQRKSKTYSITNQVKRGISWSVTSNGSYRSKKRRSSKTQQGRRVIRFIRKAFFLALTCVISDLIFTVIQLTVTVPELVYLVLFDINLLINIICIILSFRNWPQMMFPLCSKKLKTMSKPLSDHQRLPSLRREKNVNTPHPPTGHPRSSVTEAPNK